jgi:MtN3 and saliva related transmembrane protein
MITGFLLNSLATVAGVVLAFCYIPQIKQTLKTKDVSGINLNFWIILCVALFLLTVNAGAVFIMTGVWGYLLTEVFNLGLALTMLILVIKYRKKK